MRSTWSWQEVSDLNGKQKERVVSTGSDWPYDWFVVMEAVLGGVIDSDSESIIKCLF